MTVQNGPASFALPVPACSTAADRSQARGGYVPPVSQDIAHRLVPQLAHLRTDLLSDPATGLPRDGGVDADVHLEQLPYCLGAAWAAARRLIIGANGLAELPDVKRLAPGARKIILLTTDSRDPLAHEVDAYLGAARRAQNGVVPYLSRVFRRSLPTSLHKVNGRLSDGRLSIQPDADSLITRYWAEAGARLRAYRDLSEHHAIVASDARVVRAASGRVCLYLALPNNPEVKSAARLSYDPPVHALEYVVGSFLILCSFVSRLVDVMTDQVPSSGMVAVTFNFKGALRVGPGQWPPLAYPVLSEGDFEHAISRFRENEDKLARARQAGTGALST